MAQIIYLDNHATTACSPEVVEAMMPYFSLNYGNAASTHQLGSEANEAVSTARKRVAKLIGAGPHEIIFTSGATESNNLALLGAATKHQQLAGKRKRIVTSAVEHKSVLSTCAYLSELGWEVVYLPVDRSGLVRLDEAARLIDDTTMLVSVQAANSELGTVQPVAALVELAHQVGALFHCDASQAVGKIPVDVNEWGVDLLSVSGHKMHAPKGIGALFIRENQVPITPLVYGGGQEQGLRAGTLPVPLVVGLGEACNLNRNFIEAQAQHMRVLRDRLETTLRDSIRLLRVNGNLASRLPNTSNITFFNVEADLLLAQLPDVMLSTGSACESGSIEPSAVLMSTGMNYEECFCTLRFGLSRYNTLDEIDLVAGKLSEAWRSLEQSGLLKIAY